MSTNPKVKLSATAVTNIGLVRENNQDSVECWTHNEPGHSAALCVVADGMGGHESGEVASQIAVEQMVEQLQPMLENGVTLNDEFKDEFIQAVHTANDAIFNYSVDNGIQPGNIGTTLECVVAVGGKAFVAHVGDSRVYRLGADGLQQVTEDHSAVAELVQIGLLHPEEVYTHPHRNILTRGLGNPEPVEVDVEEVSLRPGERMLLCSDGLWGLVRDDDLERILLKAEPTEKIAQNLIDAALSKGGDDNISVVILDVLLGGSA